MSATGKLITTFLALILAAMCWSTTARGIELPPGNWGFAGVTALSKLQSAGLTLMNNRLGNSTSLKVTEQHGSGIVYGGRIIFAAAEYPWIAQFSADSLTHSISNYGVGSRVKSDISYYNALASYEWRLLPNGILRMKFPRERRFSRRSYLTVGPVAGLSWATNSYTLNSILEDSSIEYASSSLLAAGGVQSTLGYAVSRNLHIGAQARGVWSYPVHSTADISKFLVYGQDVRFRKEELGVEKTTGSLLTQYSASAFLALLF